MVQSNLISCLSKLLEKRLLTRITPYLRTHNVIPAHQFGFRERHGTIEQVNRITSKIRTAFEHRDYCRAIFLNVFQAFDIITLLPEYTQKLFESYFYHRVFAVKCNTTTSNQCTIEAGLSQGSALGPIQFILYTAHILTTESLITFTFADDTAILSRSRCPTNATVQLPDHLVVVEKWLSDWRIKINKQKCKHITFTFNRQSCPAKQYSDPPSQRCITSRRSPRQKSNLTRRTGSEVREAGDSCKGGARDQKGEQSKFMWTTGVFCLRADAK